MIRKTQAQVNIRRMVSTLKRFQFETKNDEHYLAKFQNEYYQKKRPSFKGLSFSKQSELPSLPVPELSVTLQKYLASIAPYCSTNDELEKQRKLCSDFAKEGTFLHERLLKYAENKRNWMSLFWDNQAYLEYNDPIIPYVSYFYGHRPLPCSHKAIEEDYLLKATAIICSVVKFIEVLKDESLPPEVFRGKPFCMNSFQLMFNNSRIPGDGRDSNVFYSIYENNFLTVVYKGNFYKVYTHNQDTLAPLPAGDIWRQLYAIVHKVSVGVKEETNVGIGILTTLPRDEWNSAYHELQTSPLSSSSLETIHRSSFILCLEVDKKPVTLEDKSRIYWHSDAVNRYNDKALQFIVCGNGASGFIAEHSKMDGTPTLFLNEYVNRELEGLDPQKFIASLGSFGATSTYTPEHLPFLLTPAIQQAIKQARVKFNDTIAEHDLSVWSYNKYGKDTIKSFGFSPDAYIQQIIQLGIYKYLGKQLPTYEAASTRGYFKGRTEAGRSVTLASAKFLKFWQSPEASNAQKVEALRDSAKAHSTYLEMATNGQGIDRHFFGMKNMLREGDAIPGLFKDSLFRYSCTWLVSTSQLSSEYHDCYGWSQVNENGVGLAYMVKKDGLHINIVTKPEKSGYNVHELHYYFTEAANEMYALLSKNSRQDSKL